MQPKRIDERRTRSNGRLNRLRRCRESRYLPERLKTG
jgi:hypothetical protein